MPCLSAISSVLNSCEGRVRGCNCGSIGAVNYRGKRLRPSQASLWQKQVKEV